MNLLMKACQINGLPVVTIPGGDDFAEVRYVIYDPGAGTVVGLTLNERGFFSGRPREVLPAEAIHAMGRDAVMIADQSSLTAPGDATQRHWRRCTHRGGKSLGVVRDRAILAGGTGEVVGYQIAKTSGEDG